MRTCIRGVGSNPGLEPKFITGGADRPSVLRLNSLERPMDQSRPSNYSLPPALYTASFMKPIDGYFVIKPEDLFWRPSNMMKIPNADFLERTKSEILGARLWRLPPKSANTLHRHPKMEEFYFVVEGVGRIRIEDQTLTVPKHGGVLVGPAQLRQA